MRAGVRAGVYRLIRMVGFDPQSANDVLSDLRTHSVRLVGALTTSAAAPVAELAFISVLYTLIEPDLQSTFVTWLERSPLAGTEVLSYPRTLLGIAGLVLLVLTITLKYVSGMTRVQFRESAAAAQAGRVVEAILDAPPHWSGKIDRPQMASLAVTEAGNYGQAVYLGLDILWSAASVLVFLLTLLVAAPVLVWVSGIVAATALVATGWGRQQRRTNAIGRAEADATLMGRLWETLNGHQTVKVEGGERFRSTRVRAGIEDRRVWRIRVMRNKLLVGLGTESAVFLTLFTVIVISVAVLDMPSTLLVWCLVMMSRLQKYVDRLQQAWLDLQHNLPIVAAMSTALAKYRTVDRPIEPAQAGPRPAVLHLQLENVSFEYEAGLPVVSEVTLDLGPGERVLIQGPSGEGKSTLLFLACGLLAPTSGRVLINGEPLSVERFYRLRPSVAYVAPDAYLFGGSVRENLCMGINYSDEAIGRAIRQARFESVIERLKGGIDGGIGDNGSELSLGERQRLMLARIFLKQPLLVLLDEATTNLDRDNERVILASLFENLDPAAAVVMVTHREPHGIPFSRAYDLRNGRLEPATTSASAATV